MLERPEEKLIDTDKKDEPYNRELLWRCVTHVFNIYTVITVFVEILLIVAFLFGGCYGSLDMRIILGIYLVVTNVLTISVFMYHKYPTTKVRLPQSVVFIMTFFAGSIGALFGLLSCCWHCCYHYRNKSWVVYCVICLVILNFQWVVVFFMIQDEELLDVCYEIGRKANSSITL